MKLASIYKYLFKDRFIRNVSTLSLGTVVSQGIVVMFVPLLTRVYSVEAFGILSVFTSFSVFFAVLATGRYEFAIALPEDKGRALKLIKLILYIGFFVSLTYVILIFCLRNIIDVNDRTGFLNSGTVYYAPLYIFLMAINTALGYWLLRGKKYKIYTIANALQVIATTLFSIILGFFKIEAGMVFALILGSMCFCIYVLTTEKNIISELKNIGEVVSVAKEFKDFPKFMTFSDLSTTAGQQFLPVLLTALYNTTIVGFFSMANRMLRLPNIIITSSIASVFRNDAISEIREKGNCVDLYVNTLKKLIVISFPVYITLFFISPYLFQFVFGDRWYMAGIFARVISVFLLFEFIANPLNVLFTIRNKQKSFMFLQTLNTVLGMLMLIMGFHLFKKPIGALISYSINAVIFNIIFLIKSYTISRYMQLEYLNREDIGFNAIDKY